MPIEEQGYFTTEELAYIGHYPSDERMKKGPIAVIECTQDIPCNPCETLCRRGAITVGSPITNIPRIDEERCNGCALCVAGCPGLAVFVVDKYYSDDKATVTFPHEYLPLPRAGDEVSAVDRTGSVVCRATVLRVANSSSFDRTSLITIAIPREHVDVVRGIKRLRHGCDPATNVSGIDASGTCSTGVDGITVGSNKTDSTGTFGVGADGTRTDSNG